VWEDSIGGSHKVFDIHRCIVTTSGHMVHFGFSQLWPWWVGCVTQCYPVVRRHFRITFFGNIGEFLPDFAALHPIGYYSRCRMTRSSRNNCPQILNAGLYKYTTRACHAWCTESMLLKWIFENKMWWWMVRIESGGCSYEDGDEISGSIKHGEFLTIWATISFSIMFLIHAANN
jgi:hypothetical protein